jgi:hypothetical protein
MKTELPCRVKPRPGILAHKVESTSPNASYWQAGHIRKLSVWGSNRGIGQIRIIGNTSDSVDFWRLVHRVGTPDRHKSPMKG